MTPLDFLELTRQGIYVLLIVAAPPMLVALLVGLIISLFQALTQIQEATLTFVPKIVAVLLTLVAVMPFMMHHLTDYTLMLMEKIAQVQ